VGAYRDSFPNAFATSGSCLGSKIEILLVPDVVVCALYHYHVDHPIAVPIGFMSVLPEQIEKAKELIYECSIRDHQIRPMGGRDEIKQGEDDPFEFMRPH
jgi:hypothetical protein